MTLSQRRYRYARLVGCPVYLGLALYALVIFHAGLWVWATVPAVAGVSAFLTLRMIRREAVWNHRARPSAALGLGLGLLLAAVAASTRYSSVVLYAAVDGVVFAGVSAWLLAVLVMGDEHSSGTRPSSSVQP